MPTEINPEHYDVIAPESFKFAQPKPLKYHLFGGLFKKRGDWNRIEKVLDKNYVQPKKRISLDFWLKVFIFIITACAAFLVTLSIML